MIIECGHCGAPLDVKANERVNKCRYCGTSNQVKSQRTIAFDTPEGWRPPPQWTPPAHFAANSQQVLTYRAAASTAAWVVGLSVLSVVLIGGAIAASVIFSASRAATQVGNVQAEVDRATRQAGDAIAQALAQASAAQAEADRALGGVPGAASAAQANLLTNAGVRHALDAYKQATGASTLQVKRLTLHDAHSSAELQSPQNPQHLDSYDYMNGRVSGPDPQRLSEREKKGLSKLLFDPEKTALLQLETLKQVTMSKLAYEEAKITHVIVDRDRGKIEILVYAGSARETGYVSFDEKGKVVRVAK